MLTHTYQFYILTVGGTSISYIATEGGLIVGSSGGSVATTASSRAICFAASLAAHWGLHFRLPQPPTVPHIRSVFGAAMPVLVTTMVIQAVIRSIENTSTTQRLSESIGANAMECLLAQTCSLSITTLGLNLFA